MSFLTAAKLSCKSMQKTPCDQSKLMRMWMAICMKRLNGRAGTASIYIIHKAETFKPLVGSARVLGYGILPACSRLSDSGKGAKECERWKAHTDLTTMKRASNSLHTYRSENNSGRFKGGVQSLPITRPLFTSLLLFLHVNVWFTIFT